MHQHPAICASPTTVKEDLLVRSWNAPSCRDDTQSATVCGIMFPAIDLPKFSEGLSPEAMAGSDAKALMANMGYVYSTWLFKDMSALLSLATTMFTDLNKEFEALKNRFTRIHTQVQQFKTSASAYLAKNLNANPLQFANNPYSNIDVKSLTEAGNSGALGDDSLVDMLVNRTSEPFSMKVWSPLIPNYQELDKSISNPGVFIEMFRAEMIQAYKDLVAQSDKKEKPKDAGEKRARTNKKNVAALKIIIDKVLPLEQRMLHPPPPGETQNWRPNLQFQTAKDDGSNIGNRGRAQQPDRPGYVATPAPKPYQEVQRRPQYRAPAPQAPQPAPRPVQQAPPPQPQQPVQQQVARPPAPPPPPQQQVARPPPPQPQPSGGMAPPPPPPPPTAGGKSQ